MSYQTIVRRLKESYSDGIAVDIFLDRTPNIRTAKQRMLSLVKSKTDVFAYKSGTIAVTPFKDSLENESSYLELTVSCDDKTEDVFDDLQNLILNIDERSNVYYI